MDEGGYAETGAHVDKGRYYYRPADHLSRQRTPKLKGQGGGGQHHGRHQAGEPTRERILRQSRATAQVAKSKGVQEIEGMPGQQPT